MELENIKLQTTWNDAAASINTNFSKIKRAVRDGIPVVDTPVDDIVSDTSENAIQNKVIKKYVDDLENNIKTNSSEYVKLKTINGKSLYGSGNIVIEGGEGGTGLQYAVERTVYPTRLEAEGDEPIDMEITEEERAYNIETYTKAYNDGNVFVAFRGFLLSSILTVEQNRYALFNCVMEHGGVLVSITITILANGDAVGVMKTIQTGGGLETPSDMNGDFSNDF